ncbi:MAG: hypothetical protein E4G98_04150 [Promethearchaeota archaeon]|nr:MAG: hypothetical protein E4G98_04150 [Candidatus Lokiarchaeota archaeon]
MIAKSFIYLNNSQQKKYLEELSSVNIADLETRKELIHVIQNLPIPRPQKEFLIEQLQYLNETEQTDFVLTLESVQSEDITEKPSEPKKSLIMEATPSEGQHIQKEDSETLSQQNEIEITPEANSETIQEDLNPEFLLLQEERDKLLQLKQEKLSDEKVHQQAVEKQKLEEERLERVKTLK